MWFYYQNFMRFGQSFYVNLSSKFRPYHQILCHLINQYVFPNQKRKKSSSSISVYFYLVQNKLWMYHYFINWTNTRTLNKILWKIIMNYLKLIVLISEFLKNYLTNIKAMGMALLNQNVVLVKNVIYELFLPVAWYCNSRTWDLE